MGPALMIFLVYAGAVIVLFFVTRIFWLWYFKLDRIEAHLAAISSALKLMTRETVARDAAEKKISENRKEAAVALISAIEKNSNATLICPKCNCLYVAGAEECEDCKKVALVPLDRQNRLSSLEAELRGVNTDLPTENWNV